MFQVKVVINFYSEAVRKVPSILKNNEIIKDFVSS